MFRSYDAIIAARAHAGKRGRTMMTIGELPVVPDAVHVGLHCRMGVILFDGI